MRGEKTPFITPQKAKKLKTTEGENIPQWGKPLYNPPKRQKNKETKNKSKRLLDKL